ncbi:MAG TPA: HlyD family efflux transporter periplasmic adaptor subunit [Pseudolabrys sp.]|nr:HlyD family efflux transporter periplasmic adaptor subunit [Pseudolabrys sp.]
MRHSDFAFANDVRAAAELRTPKTARLVLIAIIALLTSGAVWAHFAVLDEVKRGAGRVIPSRQMQVVQSLEGGIIKNILVQEGDTVQEGQPVVQLDNTKFSSDLGELEAKREALASSLKLINRELDLTQRLYNQKVVPEIEMLRLQRQVSDMTGQLAITEETIKSAKDRLHRTALSAPVYGIVNKINITTIGAVVQPGANIMDIVPLDDTLLVEGRINPQDIAFIRPGQDAVVKITAYESTVYGSLKAKVERISADTIEEKSEKTDKPQTFYRVIVRTDKNFLGTKENPLPIIPGMVTTVEILTGRKTVLDYLLKPARLLKQEALRER